MEIKLNVTVGADHRIIIDLPDSVPENTTATVLINFAEAVPVENQSAARKLKAAFEAAGYIQFRPTSEQAADIEKYGMMSETELEEFVAALPDDMPTSEEMIRDIRGSY